MRWPEAKHQQRLDDLSVYRFVNFELDLRKHELRTNGRRSSLSNKALGLLVHLIDNRMRLVSRDELLRVLWPDVRVAPGSINQAVWEIRKALGDPLRESRIIKTSRLHGYRFVAEVRVDSSERSGLDTRWPHDLRKRLDDLPDETRKVVLELATELAAGPSRQFWHAETGTL